MTLAEMRFDCRVNTHDVAATGRTDAEWNSLINSALRDFERAVPNDAESSIALAVGDSTVALPATVAIVPTPAVIDEGTPLDRVHWRELPDDPQPGRASAYALRDRTLVFSAAADAARTLKIRFNRLEALLVADGDTPRLDPQFHEGVVFLATWRALLADRETDAAAQWLALGSEIKRQAVQAALARHEIRRSREEEDE